MRELRFRAWVFNGERLKKPRYSDNDWLYKFFEDCNEDDTDEFGEPQCIEQYTGLKDRNGKEIYEGDIIQEKGLLSLTCVEWDKNNARYITEVLDKSKCVSATFHFDIIDALKSEVVGNIHENPELLEHKG